MNEWKRVLCLAGPASNRTSAVVELEGTRPDERLMPKMARRAARLAFGHSSGVTVWESGYRYGYRLYANTARKLTASLQ
jgi:hypothetical protein